MPSKRKPSAEIVAQDKQIVGGMAAGLRALSERHGSEMLRYTANLLDELVDAPTPAAKPRVRKPKAAPLVVEMPHAAAE